MRLSSEAFDILSQTVEAGKANMANAVRQVLSGEQPKAATGAANAIPQARSEASAAGVVEERVDRFAQEAELSDAHASHLRQIIDQIVTDYACSVEFMERKLEILYEHEKKHLDLLKEYKEEIKFARTMQEDLRRERSQFFAQTLKEVSTTLKQAQVDDVVAADWVQELVRSYTASLDVSGDLVRTTALDRLGGLSEMARATSGSVERSLETANGKGGDED